MEKLEIAEVKRLVCDRLDIKTSNISLNARMGKDLIKIQNFFFKNILNGEPLYCFVPKLSTKIKDGEWEYDISSFKIYKISKESLEKSSFNVALVGADNKNWTDTHLTEDLVVYDSDKGITVADTGATERNLTAREYACLMLDLPESGTKWLDDLIVKKNKNKLLVEQK